MVINGISSSTSPLFFQLRSPAKEEAISGGADDSVTFSTEGLALSKAKLHIKTLELGGQDAADSSSEEADFTKRLQGAVAKTLDYLGQRLAKAIGQLEENGHFTGKQRKALENLQARLERSMKGDPLRRTMDILKDGAEAIEAALGQGLEEIINETMVCFRQNLSESFRRIRVINLIALDTEDLFSADSVSTEEAVRLYDKYADSIPLPGKLSQSRPGNGMLYDVPDTPSADEALKTLYSEIYSGFGTLLREFLGPESAFMDTLSSSFMTQAHPALFRQ